MRSPHGALTILLLALAAAHLAFARLQPAPTAFGDETHYAKVVRRDLADGTLSLLPGAQRPAMRPEFAARVFANLAPESAPERSAEPSAEALIARVTPLHLWLHLATLALVFRQARLLGLSGWGSFVAAAALGLLPWASFHVQALWPEVLHGFFAALGLASLLEYRARAGRSGGGAWPGWPCLWLVAAGLGFGYALLTKSTLSLFLPPATLFVFCWSWSVAGSPAKRVARALVPAVLFAGACALVVAPQMSANRSAGLGFGLGANRWWNLELALVTPARVASDAGEPADPYGLAKWELQRALTDDYMAVSKDPLEREAAARTRVLRHLEARGLGSVALEQLTEFVDVLLARPGLAFFRAPCLEQALGYRARWGQPPPAWIAALAWPARPLWWLLLATGAVGLGLGARRDRRFWLPLALALCVLLVVLAVPLKFRFLQPLIPVLCLGAGCLAERTHINVVSRRQVS